MKYKFRGRVSPPLCWLTVYRFDPCDGQGKPIIALRSSIYIQGKKLGKSKTMKNKFTGAFEALEVFKTSQKYDYARAMIRVETVGNPQTPKDVTKKCSLIANSVYHGAVIDYVRDTDIYRITVGSRLYDMPSHWFSDVSPDILSTSVVCFRLKTGDSVSTDSFLVGDFKVKCFQAQTFSEVDTGMLSFSTTNNLETKPNSIYSWPKQKVPSRRTVCDQSFLQNSSNLDLVPPTAPTPVPRTSVTTAERLFPDVQNSSSLLTTRTSHSVGPESQRKQSHLFTSNEVSNAFQSRPIEVFPSHHESDESVSFLTLQELDDLAPKLTTLQKLYEEHGIYDKPIVTIS